LAIYHLSVKTISRSAGRSATAAAAYRAGVQITDERTGDVHDYSRRGGVEFAELVLPVGAPSWAADRSALWNAAEQAEKRKNSTVAREFELALPAELSPAARRELAVSFARELVERHGCAADVCIHAPGKEGDNRNHHAHVLLTTRRLGPEGFGEKTRELDEVKAGAGQLVTEWRERFAELQNERLQAAGLSVRVDHRTLADQGIDRVPTMHLGPAAVGYERRTGEVSRKREDWEAWVGVSEQLRQAQLLGELERRQIEISILDLSTDLAAAKAEQLRLDRMSVAEIDREISRIAVPPVRDLVERDPAVVRLGQEVEEREHCEGPSLAVAAGLAPARPAA
jgi:ATP-dependent exoDNAse (exonuclease V) alpha subunit